MSLAVKIGLAAVMLWQCVYGASAAVWEIKNSNLCGGIACAVVVLLMSAALGMVIFV